MLKKLYRFISPRFQSLFLEYPVDMKPRYGHGHPPHQGLNALIETGRERYGEAIHQLLSHADVLKSIPLNSDRSGQQPSWINAFFPGLDTAVLFSMLGELKPKRYVEVGSGNSTKVAAMAKRHFGLHTEITSVDPMPRAEIDQLANVVIRAPFEQVNMDLFTSLEAGDVLFIDNSHRLLPNSDVTVFFMEVLPVLKSGVVVHIHDIYLPYDYPQFMCDRFYSEQYPLAVWMLANPDRTKVLMPNYFISQDAALASLMDDFWNAPELKGVERHGGSFWIELG
jgi:hypothetical protein